MPKTKSKKLVRNFKLHVSNDLFICKKWTNDVIRGIENDRLLVLKVDDVFSLDVSDDSHIQLDSRFKNPVSIKEWLPIACQSIRRQSGPLDDFDRPAVACYKSNAGEVLFPSGLSCMPPGPVAFDGAIVFDYDFVSEVIGAPKGEDKFKFVLAHELVHVFNFMRLMVPAFKNWTRFWDIVLNTGSACDDMALQHMYSNFFVDKYGTAMELDMITEYWPTSAKKWFDAFRS